MKPPVVHQPVQPPAPTDTGGDGSHDPSAQPGATPPGGQPPGLVGSDGPLVSGPASPDRDGAGADERKAP